MTVKYKNKIIGFWKNRHYFKIMFYYCIDKIYTFPYIYLILFGIHKKLSRTRVFLPSYVNL